MPRQPHSPAPEPRSGGEVKKGKASKATPQEVRLSVPPNARRPAMAHEGTASLIKTIIVQNETGRIVSVTRVAPDARFGVGVKVKPGQTVREFEAGSLADAPPTAQAATPADAGARAPRPTRRR